MGANRISLAICIRQAVSSNAIHQKSFRALCTPLARVMQLLEVIMIAAWSWLKRLQTPGRARDIDCSLPRTFCHFCKEVCFCVWGMEDRTSLMCYCWCSGRWMVCAWVSMIQPKTSLTVSQEQLPCFNFLMKPVPIAVVDLKGQGV